MKCRLFIKILMALFLVVVAKNAQSQEMDTAYIQFSGVVVTADSLNPVSFATIILTNKITGYQYGTISDVAGFFSFVAQRSDTVRFSSVGFKPVMYVIPDTISNERYSLIQLMHSDTIFLAETVIYPWPSKEDFADAFVNMDIPDDEITIGQKNLERARLRTAARMGDADGSINYKYTINQQTNKLYYAGGVATNQLLNPFAWVQFIKAWKEGRFRVDPEEKKAIKEQKKIDRRRWDYDEWIEKE